MCVANSALNPVKPLPAPSHGPIALVEEGEPHFTIVWDSAAETNAPHGVVNRPIRDAVRTLRRELYFCTGRDVPVADFRDSRRYEGRPLLLVGRSPLTDELGIDPSSMPPEGFVATTFSNGVAIVGNDSSIDPEFPKPSPLLRLGPRRATLWGAYDFLERFLGCRYYYPGPDGCVRPKCERLVLGPFAYSDSPRFRNRGGAPSDEDAVARTLGRGPGRKQLAAYLAASRAATTEPFHAIHSPQPELWAAANPDMVERAFMRNLNGEKYFSPTNHHENHFDVTNLEFADALVRSHERLYASGGKRREGLMHSNERYCVFGQCDSFCPLEVMMANETVVREELITAEHLALGPTGWYADVYGRFYHRLADGIAKRLPGRRLVVLPYGGCVHPPILPRYRLLPGNVEAGVCLAKMPRFIRNPEARRVSVNLMRRWQSALGGRPVREIWTYNAGNTCFEQAVANEFLPEMIEAFGDSLGDVGIIVETGMYPPPVPGLCPELHFYYGTYCAMRAQWGGAAFNPAAALDEHWGVFYGERGGELLRRLHATLRQAFLGVSVRRGRSGSVYPPDVLDRIETDLAAAAAFFEREGDDLRRRRFRLMAMPLEFELDRQRGIHAGTVKEPERLRYVAGDE